MDDGWKEFFLDMVDSLDRRMNKGNKVMDAVFCYPDMNVAELYTACRAGSVYFCAQHCILPSQR